MKTTIQKIIDTAAADTTVVTEVGQYDKVLLLVDYVRTDLDSAGTLTFYGAVDDKALTKYLLGIKPVLTGDVDADGAIAYTASTTVLYEVVGIHKYLYLSWNETTALANLSIWLIGKEER
jgi:hypothetical protein